MSTRDRPNYGRGVQAVDTSDPDALVSVEDLAAQIRRVLDAPDYQPPSLPQVAMKLMALARQPQIEFHAVAGVLEQDPMLAAKVLARAQSALYMATSPVRTLRDAVVRLGLRTVRDLVLEVSLNLRVFNAPLYSGIMERVRRHSVATAYAARLDLPLHLHRRGVCIPVRSASRHGHRRELDRPGRAPSPCSGGPPLACSG